MPLRPDHPPRRSLSREFRFRQSWTVEFHREYASRLRQSGELAGVAQMAGRRDIQRLEIGSTERTHRRAHGGDGMLGEELPLGRDSNHLPTTIERAPVAALAIDRATVGPIGLLRKANEHALVVDVPALHVEII